MSADVNKQPISNPVIDHLGLWSSVYVKKAVTGRGSNGKISPYGIQKLRELILELAVRGKLVPQDPDDEPASELLAKVEAQKARLVKDGKIKKPKVLAPIEEGEELFELPEGWGFARFGAVLDFSGGGQPPKSTFSDEKLDSYVQLIQIRDLGPNPQPVYVPKDSVSKFCTPADVMIGRYGASVGKVFWGKEGAYNVALIKLHNDYGAYIPHFLFILMKSPLGQSLFSGISRSAQAGFKKGDIEGKLLPILSRVEQHRIVAKVDEFMALCDQLERQQTDSLQAHQTLVETLLRTLVDAGDEESTQQAWSRIAEHFDTLFSTEESIDQLKQTILQLAVMGRLAPQDPNDEPADLLLEKIAEEKKRLVREGSIKTQRVLSGVSDLEKPYELPSGWSWARLGDVGVGNTGKTPSTRNEEYYGGKTPFIGPGQITPSGEILDADKHLTDEGCEYSVLAEPGDVLMVCIGGSIGKSAITNASVAFNQQINSLRPILVSSELLDYSMNTPQFQASVLEKATGSATPIINRSKWEELLIPVAPEGEQHRIVTKVDELMESCDTLKTSIQDAQTTQVHFADAVVEQVVSP